MVHDAESLSGFGLDRLKIPVFLQTRIHEDIHPTVRSFGRHHQVLRQLHDEIRRSDVPFVQIFELARRRHVGEISFRCAAVHPLHDRGDLFVR